MFDKLIDVLVQFAGYFQLYTIVYHWERGVHLRNGVYLRTVEPGIRWHLPLVDSIMTETVVPNTEDLRAQNVTTQDGVELAVSMIIKYRIDDVKAYLLEVEGKGSAVADICLGSLSEYVAENTHAHIRDPRNWRRMATTMRAAGKEYGINVLSVRLSDITRAKTIRLIQ